MSVGESVRNQFPLLERHDAGGRPLVYLDSAATALKPACVIDQVRKVLSYHTSNVHRSVHLLGDESTEIYEGARRTIADFLGADEHEIVLLRNATEGLNLVARCWPNRGRTIVGLGEHHSNLLPWTERVTRLGVDRTGRVDTQQLERELQKGDVGLVSISHVSNVTGLSHDAARITELAHRNGAVVMIDAAQSAPHQRLDVYDLDADFLVFSGHKMGGPTGCGVLFGKAEHLERMDMYLRGGSTVEEVHAASQTPKPPPWRFEAGTPAIESAAGLASAIQFLERAGLEAVHRHQVELASHTVRRVRQKLPKVKIVGEEDETRSGPVSLLLPGVSPHLIARGLSDGYATCVRSGFHCAQPLHEALSISATLRLSFFVYNTIEEIDQTVDAIAELLRLNG